MRILLSNKIPFFSHLTVSWSVPVARIIFLKSSQIQYGGFTNLLCKIVKCLRSYGSLAMNINKLLKHFTLIVFWYERRNLLCSHTSVDIFTREDVKFLRESSPGISLVFI